MVYDYPLILTQRSVHDICSTNSIPTPWFLGSSQRDGQCLTRAQGPSVETRDPLAPTPELGSLARRHSCFPLMYPSPLTPTLSSRWADISPNWLYPVHEL